MDSVTFLCRFSTLRTDGVGGAGLTLRWSLNLERALILDMRQNSPGTFSLFHPDYCPAFASPGKVQAHVIVRSLHVSKVIKIYDAAIGQTYKIHG